MAAPDHLSDRVAAAVSGLMDDLVASDVLPGATVLVLRGGEEVLYHEVGARDVASGTPIARDTIVRLFSMTKPLTAAAVMVLVDEGVLGLEDPVVDFVPEFADLRVRSRGGSDRVVPARALRIEHLLTHTAGFSYWFYPDLPVSRLYADDPDILDERWRFDPEFGGLDGLARSLGRLPLVGHPGGDWHYSMSLDVAGIVIERAAGRALDEFMTATLFDPLAMTDTGFSVGSDRADRLASLYGPRDGGGIELLESAAHSPLLGPVPGLAGGGGLVSTIDDYARFAEMLRRRGELGGVRVLSESSARAMMTDRLGPHQLAELGQLAPWGLGGTGDGLGFGLGGTVVVDPPAGGVPAFRGEYSWGGGASTTFWVDPQNQLTVVAMTQLWGSGTAMLRDELHRRVYTT